MSDLDPIDKARDEARESLLGHHGIVGVGRTEGTVVFFVADRLEAAPVLAHWIDAHDVTVDVEDVTAFRPAGPI